jgi:hypothetical protein
MVTTLGAKLSLLQAPFFATGLRPGAENRAWLSG